jgi:hypothetical protein
MDNLEKTLDDANIQMDQEVSQNLYSNWQAVPPLNPKDL